MTRFNSRHLGCGCSYGTTIKEALCSGDIETFGTSQLSSAVGVYPEVLAQYRLAQCFIRVQVMLAALTPGNPTHCTLSGLPPCGRLADCGRIMMHRDTRTFHTWN